MRSSFGRVGRELLRWGTGAAILLCARASLADHYRVPSGSMEPTVAVGDHILVDKEAYGLRVPLTTAWVAEFGAPKRGDVVVLLEDGVVLLKRVIATSGELVDVHEGRVTIDGTPLQEPYVSTAFGGGPALGPVRVPHGQLLVLGDNRGNSRDGREFGWVPRERVLGRAVAVVARGGAPIYEPL